MFLAGVERAQSLTERAVDVLECLLADRKHPSVCLRAAHHILDFSAVERLAPARSSGAVARHQAKS